MPGKRLYRSTADRRIAGVCGGIAEYFDIDPVFVRIAALISIFLHGLGVIAYVICWIAIPQREGASRAPAGRPDDPAPEPAPPAPSDGPSPRKSSSFGGGELIGGAVLIFVGLVFLMANLGVLDWDIFHFWRWRVIWPLLVIGLGIYVVSASLRSRPGGAGHGRT